MQHCRKYLKVQIPQGGQPGPACNFSHGVAPQPQFLQEWEVQIQWKGLHRGAPQLVGVCQPQLLLRTPEQLDHAITSTGTCSASKGHRALSGLASYPQPVPRRQQHPEQRAARRQPGQAPQLVATDVQVQQRAGKASQGSGVPQLVAGQAEEGEPGAGRQAAGGGEAVVAQAQAPQGTQPCVPW